MVRPGVPLVIEVETVNGKAVLTIRLRFLEEGEGGGGEGGGGPEVKAGPLARDLAKLFEEDGGAQKATHAQALAKLYQWAGEAISDSESYPTAGKFREALGEKSAELLPTDVLLPLRGRIRDELRTVLPPQAGTELTPEQRKRTRALFGRLAEILSGLGE